MMVVSWLFLRFFMEDLLIDHATGMCSAELGLKMKPVKSFE